MRNSVTQHPKAMYLTLVIVHIAGAVLGVGGATFLEIFLTKSLIDGKVDPTEGSFLHICYAVVRIGLILALFSGFGFLLLYAFSGQTSRLLNPVLWAKMTMIVIIAVNALLLQAKKINLFWGSSFSFVSWWSTLILGTFLTQGVRYSYIEIMFWYLAAILCGAGILEMIRTQLRKRAARRLLP